LQAQGLLAVTAVTVGMAVTLTCSLRPPTAATAAPVVQAVLGILAF
jgi:hypothetical protein